MSNWNTFCYYMTQSEFKYESEIEEKYKLLLDTVYGWHAFEGKIKSQYPVNVGHETKKADIVLFSKNKPQLVIELKCPGFEPQKHEEEQLKSYMKILGCEYGFIANDEQIYLYYSAFSDHRIHKYACIPYTSNEAGEKLSAILNCDDFALPRLDAFKKEMELETEKARIADELAKKLAGKEGKRILKEALLEYSGNNQLYNPEIIELAFKSLEIKRIAPPIIPSGGGDKTGFTGFIKKRNSNG